MPGLYLMQRLRNADSRRKARKLRIREDCAGVKLPCDRSAGKSSTRGSPATPSTCVRRQGASCLSRDPLQVLASMGDTGRAGQFAICVHQPPSGRPGRALAAVLSYACRGIGAYPPRPVCRVRAKGPPSTAEPVHAPAFHGSLGRFLPRRLAAEFGTHPTACA